MKWNNLNLKGYFHIFNYIEYEMRNNLHKGRKSKAIKYYVKVKIVNLKTLNIESKLFAGYNQHDIEWYWCRIIVM